MSDGLRVELRGDVRHLVLDAPRRRHALSRPMLTGLAAALLDVPAEVTGVVLRGSGDTFSSGADFAELTGTSADVEYDERVTAARRALLDCPRPVVAAIEGPCMGAAADLALACDARVVAEDGYLQVPAVRLGLLYSPDALEQHAHVYPTDAVRRLFLFGERMDGPAALAAGLATHLVPHGEAADRAAELLGPIGRAELGAVAATKQFLAAAAANTLDRDAWQRRRRELLDSPARRAAVDAARARHASGSSTHDLRTPAAVTSTDDPEDPR